MWAKFELGNTEPSRNCEEKLHEEEEDRVFENPNELEKSVMWVLHETAGR